MSSPMMAVCESKYDGVSGARVGTVSGGVAVDGDGVAAVNVDDDSHRPLLCTTNLCLAVAAAPFLFPTPREFVAWAFAVLVIVVDVGVAVTLVTAVIGATLGKEPSPSLLSDTSDVCKCAVALLPLSSSLRPGPGEDKEEHGDRGEGLRRKRRRIQKETKKDRIG